ncbi:hypothetical protein Tco_1200392 [Tanacetum coccineum]
MAEEMIMLIEVLKRNCISPSDNRKFMMVDGEDLLFKKISPMAEEILEMLRVCVAKKIKVSDFAWYIDEIKEQVEKLADDSSPPSQGLGGGGYLKDYVRVVAGIDDRDSNSELPIPTPWSDDSKNEKRTKDKGTDIMKDKVSQENMCEEEVPLNNNIGKQIGDFVDMPSEVVEQRMDANVPDEIDCAKGEQVLNHVVKKGNLEFLACKEAANPGVNELVDKGRPIKRKKVGRNELGNFANVPVFIGNFYVITDFTVVGDMDPYLDEGIGEVVVGEPFCKVSCVETRRFDGIITIHDDDDSITYQMVRSNLRFKHHTNEQCNKIPPLLKVSEHDKLNGISHPYQKLKSFYKGVLNLGPEYIQDAKMEEWLTHGHIGTRWKEIDDVGEVSINMEFLLMKSTMENLSSKTSGEFLVLILLISHF